MFSLIILLRKLLTYVLSLTSKPLPRLLTAPIRLRLLSSIHSVLGLFWFCPWLILSLIYSDSVLDSFCPWLILSLIHLSLTHSVFDSVLDSFCPWLCPWLILSLFCPWLCPWLILSLILWLDLSVFDSFWPWLILSLTHSVLNSFCP